MNPLLQGIEGLNRHEIDYLCREIFGRRIYVRHGLSLTNSATVFDVGANIGVFSLFAASESPTASIYAFEPIRPIFEKLENNTKDIAGRMNLFCCGLSDREREETFTYYPSYSIMSAQTSYAQTHAEREFVKGQATRELRCKGTVKSNILEQLDKLIGCRFQETQWQCRLRRMSDIIEQHDIKKIDFLKIDVLRAEADVLRGIQESHWPIIRQISMEVHDNPETVTAGRVGTITDDLRRRGFQVVVEQGERLRGTGRHALFARRPDT